MSWSFSAIGKPKNVSAALDAESAKMTDGQCKIEFDDAKVHLQGLLAQTFNENEETTPVVKLVASGSGYAKEGKQCQRNCSVSIETFYTKLVCLMLAATLAFAAPAQAGPIRDKIKTILHHSSHEPTQVQQQDAAPCASCARERSMLRSNYARPGQLKAGDALKAPAEAPTEKTVPKDAPIKQSADLSPDESRLLVGLNQLRASHGKSPVTVDPALEQVAREQLSDPRYSQHHSPRFGSSAQHAARYANFASVNDVVSAGQWSVGSRCTPEQSCDAWRQSDGHLRCILGESNINNRWIDEGYDRVGVARGRKFDLAVFGRRDGTAADDRRMPTLVAWNHNDQCQCQSGGPCTCGKNCNCGK